MFVKYTDPKSLSKWIDDYHVSDVDFVEGLDVCGKFRNLCESAATCISKDIVNYIYSFSILVAKAADESLRMQSACAELKLINKLIENNDNWIEDAICSTTKLLSAPERSPGRADWKKMKAIIKIVARKWILGFVMCMHNVQGTA